MDEPLINLKPQTDFEKYIWAKSLNDKIILENKQLKLEIGKLKSEIQYLNNELKNSFNLKEINKQAKVEARKEYMYNMQLIENKNLRAKNKNLRKTNSDLISELIKIRL